MKKNLKMILGTIAVILAIVLLGAAGFLAYLLYSAHSNHAFEDYISTEGPWGITATWVDESRDSYLKSEVTPEGSSVTAYFATEEGWQSYEIHYIGHLASLDRIEDGFTVDGRQGRMKFNGTTFTLKFDKTAEAGDPRTGVFHYTITDGASVPSEP